MKTVIGIGGRKQTGKSTLAEYLTQSCINRGWQSQVVSFAQPIKEMLQEVFRHEVPYKTFTDDKCKQVKVEIAPDVFMTVREMLQKVGTECFRSIIHTDFWVYRGIAKIKSSSADIVIVPDVRFENELRELNKLGTTIYIDRPGMVMPEDTHPSETTLEKIKDEFDYTFVNWEDRQEVMEAFAHQIIRRL